MTLLRFGSPTGVTETMDKLVDAVERRGMRIFARIDHGGAARAVGVAIRDGGRGPAMTFAATQATSAWRGRSVGELRDRTPSRPWEIVTPSTTTSAPTGSFQSRRSSGSRTPHSVANSGIAYAS